ncbi:hypothetical protein [Archaeoglobus sp.]|nr:hypothetical protein [Archaeoglobus sp.]
MREEKYFKMLENRWSNIWPHPSLPKEPVYPLGKIPDTGILGEVC